MFLKIDLQHPKNDLLGERGMKIQYQIALLCELENITPQNGHVIPAIAPKFGHLVQWGVKKF